MSALHSFSGALCVFFQRMCFRGLILSIGKILTSLRRELQQSFASVTRVTKDKWGNLVKGFCSLNELVAESCKQSKIILALQFFVWGFGFYILVLFVPDKIEEYFSEVSNPAPHFSLGNILGIFASYLLDGYFPTSVNSALRLTQKKIVIYLVIYVGLFVSFGYKSAIRFCNNLVSYLTFLWAKLSIR